MGARARRWLLCGAGFLGIVSTATYIYSQQMPEPGRSVQSQPSPSVTPVAAAAVAPTPVVRRLGEVVLHPRFPLDAGKEWKSAYSSRMTYTAQFDGVPLWPLQQVIVMKDAQGTVTGVQSNYLPPAPPTNPVVLDATRAQAVALEALKDEDPSARSYDALPGTATVERVVWVEDRGEGAASRNAYRVVISGREQILDASDGSILSRRDRRQH